MMKSREFLEPTTLAQKILSRRHYWMDGSLLMGTPTFQMYDPHQEVNFDFSPFGGFTIRKEDPSSGDAQEGICPICGGSIEYGERESVDEGAVYFWTCMKCRATGRAGYNEVFDGNHYDVRDGNGNPFPPESEEE